MNVPEERASGFEPIKSGHEIKQNILEMVRRTVPVAEVVTGSTPVIAFGDPFRATVATLGINPSRREFLDANGELLSGPARRLATLASLQAPDTAGLNSDQAAALIRDCGAYFHRNPYRSWFDRLNEVIHAATGASYYNGSACHLDLVQWATDPIWGSLPESTRRILLNEGLPHLRHLLTQHHIRIVLLNWPTGHRADKIKQAGTIGAVWPHPGQRPPTMLTVLRGIGDGSIRRLVHQLAKQSGSS